MVWRRWFALRHDLEQFFEILFIIGQMSTSVGQGTHECSQGLIYIIHWPHRSIEPISMLKQCAFTHPNLSTLATKWTPRNSEWQFQESSWPPSSHSHQAFINININLHREKREGRISDLCHLLFLFRSRALDGSFYLRHLLWPPVETKLSKTRVFQNKKKVPWTAEKKNKFLPFNKRRNPLLQTGLVPSIIANFRM